MMSTDPSTSTSTTAASAAARLAPPPFVFGASREAPCLAPPPSRTLRLIDELNDLSPLLQRHTEDTAWLNRGFELDLPDLVVDTLKTVESAAVIGCEDYVRHRPRFLSRLCKEHFVLSFNEPPRPRYDVSAAAAASADVSRSVWEDVGSLNWLQGELHNATTLSPTYVAEHHLTRERYSMYSCCFVRDPMPPPPPPREEEPQPQQPQQ